MNKISLVIFLCCVAYCAGLGIFVLIKKHKIKKQIKKDAESEDFRDNELY